MSALLPSPSSSDETAFTYKPLSAEADTRLIELEPAPDASSPLQCHIAELCLSSDDLVEYEALSYTWGEPEFTETLHVIEDQYKTSIVKITANLSDALQRVRLSDRKRMLWVDAVCINQQDDSDKSKQIPAMAQIFSGASHVLVWLGTSPQGEIALANIKKALRFRSTGSKNFEAHFLNLESSLKDLVVLPWFRRRWIIQEVVLAADVTVMCGPEEISLIHLFRALSDLLHKSKLPPVLEPLEAISRLWKTSLLDSNPESGLRLFELLLLFHESDCQVDLDRIYALCNLASDCVAVNKKSKVETNKISIVVDYSQTADALYQSVVDQILGLETNGEGITRWVDGHYDLQIPGIDIYQEVLCAIVERCDGSSRNAKAWVPDWRLPKKREPIFKFLTTAPYFDYRRVVQCGLIDSEKADCRNISEVVQTVFEPFPKYPNMANVKNWLQAMRHRFAVSQPQFPKDKFIHDLQKYFQDSGGRPFMDFDSSQVSLDAVWCAFLYAVLFGGISWDLTRDERNRGKHDFGNLYLLSLGKSEVQVSPESWSLLYSLFTGRRIFCWGSDREPYDTTRGIGIGPDHLKMRVFVDGIGQSLSRKSMFEGHVLLWDAMTQGVSTLVGDAWVFPFGQ